MERREFMGSVMAGAALGGGRPGRMEAAAQGASPDEAGTKAEGVFIERPVAGKPHAGKVLAAIQPHADDLPFYAAGTIAKLLDEGYTGHLIRTTNDDMTGGGTISEGALANERDNQEVASVLGLKKVFDLNYSNHRMDQVMPVELRARLIFLIRLLKVDTVIGYDPWGHYEENPDHYVTARAVEASCWMAAMGNDREVGRRYGLEYAEAFHYIGLEPPVISEDYIKQHAVPLG